MFCSFLHACTAILRRPAINPLTELEITMFSRPVAAADPTTNVDVAVPPELIPLSHLALDLPTPDEGWALFLGRRAITIRPDSLGRDSIDFGSARRLLDEQRAHVLRQAAQRRVAEQAAIEQDEAFRASLGRGIPVDAIPAGMTYGEAVQEAELNSRPYSPRASVVEDLLGGGGMTFHPIRSDQDEAS